MKSQSRVGSSFDDFLDKEGLLEDSQAVAAKRVIAFQLAEEMAQQSLTKSELAKRMHTSRAALDRLLDPENPSVTLLTLLNAATALGGKLTVSFE